ncbi:MAG: TraR/DksA family transcriptional regulator [Minisyncoccia bacterium]
MDKDFIKKQEKKLIEEKKKIEVQLDSFAKKISKKGKKDNWQTKMPVFDGNQIEEESDQVEEYTHLIAIEESLEKQLEEINSALNKIKKGTYGICEVCKKEIEKERLEAFPQAKTCSKCLNR